MNLRFTKSIFLLAICSFAIHFTPVFAQQQYQPIRYYTFEDPTVGHDQMNNDDLDFQYYGSGYTVGNNGPVGKFLTMGQSGNLVKGGNVDVSNELTIEFLFKPGLTFNNTEFIRRRDKGFEVAFDFPDQTRLYSRIKFRTKYKDASNNTIDDSFIVEMDGIGLKDWGYYADGNWHHLVFKFNGNTGTKEIWVDGVLSPDFVKSVTPGTIQPFGAPPELWFNNITDYRRLHGSIDEFAIYDLDIPGSLVHKHYLEFQQGNHYTWVDDYTGSIPTAGPTTAGIDVDEFAPGHPNVTVDAKTQLYNFPGPRYKNNHTLKGNFQWFDPGKLAGFQTSNYSTTTIRHNMLAIQHELARNYNYLLLASGNTIDNNQYNDTLTLPGASVKLANDNPQWGASAITFWPQINPTHAGYADQYAYIQSQNLPADNYLRDSSGAFMSKWGGNTSTKFWSPAAPLTYTTYDGLTQKFYVQKLLNALTRPLDIINENSEIIPLYPETTLEKDPAVHTAKNNSGKAWAEYQGWAKARVSNAYSDEFMNLPGLGNTKFTEYGIDGQPIWRHEYSEARKCNDQINGQYYATGDFYPRWPQNWRYWTAAWHGWQWVADARRNEIGAGDRLFSPFVGAGWNNDPERNLRPAQWLGLLKSMTVAGAEFFYTSFFAEVVPYQNPDNWAWQVVIPSYAQALMSRQENLLRAGHLMEGDVPANADQPNGNKGYSFYSGDYRKLINVRKHDNMNKYIVTGSIQPNSNMMGNVELESEAEITLDGQALRFNVRKQGSMYYYDNTNPSSPIFYQLDGWHDYKHPYKWTKDFEFEGELFDNSNSNISIKTEVPNNTPAGDFSDFTSFITFSNTSSSPSAEYNFVVRESNPTYYLWVRARSMDGSSTGLDVELDNNGLRSIGCISSTSWEWYRYDACDQQAITYANVAKNEHTLKVYPLNDKIEIDKVLMSRNGNLVLNSASPNCSATQATISTSGSTTFCAGGSVTLTASQGTSYMWLPGGETTRSIVVTNSGNYSVIVGSGTGCSANAPSQTVNVISSVNANITSSGSNSFCQASSVTLTVTAASSYLWSPGGQTTRSI
ncbi:MAG: hypothetical protein HKN22_07655, partial [Bacteroidia bacterium]|nr:hypothetical protein [Bacteroidia bacterium]